MLPETKRVLLGYIYIFFLWRFNSITGHGLPSLRFMITLIGHIINGRTHLDE